MTLGALPKIFTAATLGGKKSPIQLKHRVVLAPMTRLRTGDDGVPGAVVVEFYTQRATDSGLLVTEGTNISATARGYYGAPGIFNSAQVEGWKKVTESVHAKGGKIFVQLWHTGRVSHQLNQPNGKLPVCPSAIGMEGVHSLAPTREGRLPHPVPRALETNEIAGIVADYKSAALKALDAGFDGVELHCANGYLIEQFLCDSINKRTDKYGGSIENRARILFEALEAVLSGVDSSKVGIRLSPYGTAFGCTDSASGELFGYIIEKLNDYDLAYLHLVEPRGIQAPAPDAPEGGVLPIFRKVYIGFIITCSGYDREEAIQVVENKSADSVAFARNFISNPDLVERLKTGAELNATNQQSVYQPLGVPFETGYTDYPILGQKE
ncbi:12-oxophytodienoate reductase, putative [Phytophthora infestans T30-4]|uniref:12-oxophytodienoate reductase, putative n=1 Tax=Phytophthora infestans (strain T30-4) TaxID=403677 RepID=D0N0Y6_PHYIT|nr:12-oxophytodienoate reductase, putative [Phytophthora infestans T30-4]EEY67299.1 12-oxophytodienoate reductase, putative [Phytophthora infestans T30-4]|eukprot:XP_002905947.1 12-oxophytodienoate reductase, putative [Phytophthora infestans T30-4]